MATVSGSVNTAALTNYGGGNYGSANISQGPGAVSVGPTDSTEYFVFGGITGTYNFVSGSQQIFANSGSGDFVQIMNGFGLGLPKNYVSGTALSSTSTWNSQTFTSLGLTPGTYVYTWGSGATADSATLTIGASPVPEPSSIIMAGRGVVGAVSLARKRKAVRV